MDLLLQKLEQYLAVFVTEHLPSRETCRAPNVDKVHGADTRLAAGSGVYLEEPPFSRAIDIVLETPVVPPSLAPGEVLRTVRLRR